MARKINLWDSRIGSFLRINISGKNLLLWLFIIVISLITVSCKETTYTKEIATLDSLNILVDKARIDLEKIDTAKVDSFCQELITNLKYIQRNYKDTMDRDLAMLLSEYASMKKNFQAVEKQKKEYMKELNYSQEQIKNLVHDLKHNAIEDNKIREYYSLEVNATKRIIESVNTLTDAVQENFSRFEQQNPKIKEIIDKLKSKETIPVQNK